MVQKKQFSYKPFKSTLSLKKLMADYFNELNQPGKNKKIAWCSSVGPAELLRSMGFLVFFPENHAAMIGASRTAANYITAAISVGYSPEICSYLTSDIGAFIEKKTPLSRIYSSINQVPRPDVLVYNTNQCRDVKDWFMWYSRELNVPCMGIESFCNVDEVTSDHIISISNQLQALIFPLEKISGRTFDMDFLKETIERSRLCSELWGRILRTAATRPSPITFFDSAIHMGPAVVGRGTKFAVQYYQQLLKELTEAVNNNIAAVDGEKYRFYWDGMPVWGRIKSMAELFIKNKTSVVASTYCNSWVFKDLNPDEPFDSMARAYTKLFICRSDKAKENYIKKMLTIYGIDGILFHEAKTCPNNSNTRYGMPKRLSEDTQIPTVTINGDLNDIRLFNEAQFSTRIEALVEQLEVLKGSK